jgi:hypothetical protein
MAIGECEVMRRKTIRYFLLFLVVVFILNSCLPIFAAAEEDTYGEDVLLVDKQIA